MTLHPDFLVVYGACRSNPGGRMGFAWQLTRSWGTSVSGGGEVSPDASNTNNMAVYLALEAGLEHYLAQGLSGPLLVLSNSQLVMRQMQGQYATVNPNLQQVRARINAFLSRSPVGVGLVQFSYLLEIPECLNWRLRPHLGATYMDEPRRRRPTAPSATPSGPVQHAAFLNVDPAPSAYMWLIPWTDRVNAISGQSGRWAVALQWTLHGLAIAQGENQRGFTSDKANSAPVWQRSLFDRSSPTSLIAAAPQRSCVDDSCDPIH